MRSLHARIAVLMLLGALSGADLARATPPTRPPNHSVDPAMVAKAITRIDSLYLSHDEA